MLENGATRGQAGSHGRSCGAGQSTLTNPDSHLQKHALQLQMTQGGGDNGTDDPGSSAPRHNHEPSLPSSGDAVIFFIATTTGRGTSSV